MISFIIIGKNIQNTIRTCIESVFAFIEVNKVKHHEIIYIDSDSTDGSLKIAMEYNIRVYLISGNVNSAVARNEGAKNAKGDILFFLDGDMELLLDFFDSVFIPGSQSLRYPFNNGYMKEHYYDNDFNFLYNMEEKLGSSPFYQHVTGGLMVLKKELWEKLGGMDERLIRNQDLDIGLRMSEIGFPVLKDKNYWIIHHTTSYLEKNRFTYFVGSKALLATGILMRKHIFNSNYLKYCGNYVIYSVIILTSIVTMIISPVHGIVLFLIYIFIQVIRTVDKLNIEGNFWRSFLYMTLFNFYSLTGFLFYYPKPPVYKRTSIKE